jgi:amino acid transporter
MKKIIFIFLLIIAAVSSTPAKVSAQCAMCTVSAEQSVKNGNTQGKGLNTGIIYLLVIPYILISGMGALWYFKYRRKTQLYAENV